jgi:uncharacterized protein YkwD
MANDRTTNELDATCPSCFGLRHSFVIWLSTFVLLCSAALAEEPPPPPQTPDLARVTALIVEQTNLIRADSKLPAVAEDVQLSAAAQKFAEFMAATTKYGHQADGREAADRTAEQGYQHCVVLENIAYRYRARGFTTEELAAGFVDGWKDSPSHREAMLDPDVVQTGVAVAYSQVNGHFYAVQLFGRPKSMQIVVQVHNGSAAKIDYTLSGGERPGTMSIPPRATATHVRCRSVKILFPATNQGMTLEPIDGYYVLNINRVGRVSQERKKGQPAELKAREGEKPNDESQMSKE